jgi:ethanolamine utilization microcompartment shell protein EutS
MVNALGDIVDPYSRSIIAGARSIKNSIIKIGETDRFANTLTVWEVYRTKIAFFFGETKYGHRRCLNECIIIER